MQGSISEFLKKKMAEKHWDNKALADETGININTIKKILSEANRIPDYPHLKAIANRFNMSTDQFYDMAMKGGSLSLTTQQEQHLTIMDIPPDQRLDAFASHMLEQAKKIYAIAVPVFAQMNEGNTANIPVIYYIYVPPEYKGSLIAYLADNDSNKLNDPQICKGDILVVNKALAPQIGDTVITKKQDGSMVFGTYVLEYGLHTIQNKVEKYDCKPNDIIRVVMSVRKALIPKSDIKTRSRIGSY